MNAKTISIAGTAAATLVLSGVLAELSPAFKQHATTVCIALLALISISGVLAAVIFRRPAHTPGLTPAAQRAPAARATTLSTHHSGGHR